MSSKSEKKNLKLATEDRKTTSKQPGSESKKTTTTKATKSGDSSNKIGGLNDIDDLFNKHKEDKKEKRQIQEEEDRERRKRRKEQQKQREGSNKLEYNRNDLLKFDDNNNNDNQSSNKTNKTAWLDDGLGGKFNKEGYTGRIEDGCKIFKAHLFNKPNFGNTKDCPFDCSCCYI